MVAVDFREVEFTRWIEKGEVDAIAAYLMSGTHHGKPGAPAKIKLEAAAAFQRALLPAAQFAWAERLARCSEHVPRVVAALLLPAGWELVRDKTTALLERLCEDEDWEVREWASGACAALLARDFDAAVDLFRRWSEDGSENLRRALAVGIRTRLTDCGPQQVAVYLELLEPMMSDPGAYLQKNLGPFAIGDGLLTKFPAPTLRFLRRMARRKDEATRWNVAMTFSTKRSREQADAGRAILARLEGDAHKSVQRAVDRARKNLGKA